MLEAAHGWVFGKPNGVLGGANIAELPGGGMCAVRGPLSTDEKPTTRVYIRVENLARTVARARKDAAEIALESMGLGEHGTIAIFRLGGIEHSIWELPTGRS
jgi:uncharacterized protein